MNAEPGSGWAIVGNYQDLSDGYEAGALAIADSKCTADHGPSLIAPSNQMTGIRPVLTTDGQSAVPRSRLAEERAETLSAANAAKYGVPALRTDPRPGRLP